MERFSGCLFCLFQGFGKIERQEERGGFNSGTGFDLSHPFEPEHPFIKCHMAGIDLQNPVGMSKNWPSRQQGRMKKSGE